MLGVMVLAIPAVTLASGGGGSAGDQQYTDPFAGTKPPASTTRTTATSAPTSTSAPATTVAPTSTTAPAPAPVTTTTTSAAADPATTPTATTALTGSQLPYTGYDGWLAAGFGLVMVAAGLGLRHRLRRS